jgi:hypothetical protein
MEFLTSRQDQEYSLAVILNACNGDAVQRGNFCEGYVERDGEGNIVALRDLGQERSTTTGKDTEPIYHWDMPSLLGDLTSLQKLAVYNCKSLPPEIGNLTQLKELSLHFCSQMESLPPELGYLPNLTDVRIHGDTAMPRIVPFIQTLYNLRYLYYRSVNGEDACMIRENLIDDLLDPRVQFKQSLEILDIEGGDLLEEDVANLFARVLPQYPRLQRIFIPNNLIRTLRPIMDVHPSVIPPTIRLRRVNLLGNPVLTLNADESPQEQLYLLKLVTLHEELSSLGRGITESGLCNTDILLTMDLNDGGRVLLSKRFRPIPLSVWPLVLERVNQLQGYYDNINVLYYLLRNGPTCGMREFFPSPPDSEDGSNSSGSRKRKADQALNYDNYNYST